MSFSEDDKALIKKIRLHLFEGYGSRGF